MNIQLLLEGQTLWSLPLLLFLSSLIIIYLYFYIQYRNTFSSIQFQSFCLAMGVIYLAYGSPLAAISYALISLHMVQMALLYFVSAPLLLMSFPVLNVLKNRKPQKQSISISIISLFLFALCFFLYHLPSAMHSLMEHTALHTGYILLLFILSLGMWAPFCWAPLATNLKASNLKRFAFWNSVGIMPACFLLIIGAFFSHVHSPIVAHLAAKLPPGLEMSLMLLPPAFDQFLAGLLMIIIHKFSMMNWG